MNTVAKSPYTPICSIKQSLDELNSIRGGKLKKKTWKELKEEIKKEDNKD